MDPSSQARRSSRPYKVLHIGPTPFFSDRGCHMRIRGIIRALNKRAMQNVLCTYNLGRDVEDIETVRTASIPGYTRLEAGPSAFKYLADVLLFFKVCGQIARRKPDIIHAYLHEGALIGWAAKVVFFWRRIPMVFDVQGSLVGELEAHGYFKKFGFLKRIFWSIEFLITRMATRFVCSSQNSLNRLRRAFNLAADNSELVNDGADEFDRSGIEALAAELALPENRSIVIYTGALQEAKGLAYLCETMLKSKQAELPCHFLVIGYPEEPLLEYCETHGLNDICTTTGRIPYEELGNYLALADIALEPKLSDSGEASGKLVNYMGAGLPVVCFENNGNRFLLKDSGYYAQAGDTGAMIEQLKTILAQPEEAHSNGEAGKRRVLEKFSWNVAGEKIQAVYDSIYANRR